MYIYIYIYIYIRERSLAIGVQFSSRNKWEWLICPGGQIEDVKKYSGAIVMGPVA